MNIHEAYLKALHDVWHLYQFRSAPRGLPIREIVDYSFKIDDPVAEPIKTKDEERNKTIETYTKKEVELYNSGTNSAEEFGKASKFWLKLANPDNTVNSAYGHLIWKKKSMGDAVFEGNQYSIEELRNDPTMMNHLYRTPWEWAKESLLRDKDTRQAVMKFNLPEHAWIGNKDFPCTMHANFLIRNDQLHMSTVMRSNDLMKGLVYDMPWFISLMDKMIEELSDKYPNLTKGTYSHLAHSMHIYEKDEKTILKMLGH